MRLKRVDFPAPFGPMMACRSPSAIVRSTPFVATNPLKDFVRFWIFSISPSPPAWEESRQLRHTGQPFREGEENNEEDHTKNCRPVLSVLRDLSFEDEEHRGPACRSEEGMHPAEDRHDEDLGRFGPPGGRR